MEIKTINNLEDKTQNQAREIFDNCFLKLEIEGTTLETVIKESAMYHDGNEPVLAISELFDLLFEDSEVEFKVNLETGMFYTCFLDASDNEQIFVKNLYQDFHLAKCNLFYYHFLKTMYDLYKKKKQEEYSAKDLAKLVYDHTELQTEFENLFVQNMLIISKVPITLEPVMYRKFLLSVVGEQVQNNYDNIGLDDRLLNFNLEYLCNIPEIDKQSLDSFAKDKSVFTANLEMKTEHNYRFLTGYFARKGVLDKVPDFIIR